MVKEVTWNEDILSVGGISHWHIQDKEKVSEGVLKPNYRVAMMSKDCDTKLKWRIKSATGNIFSVSAKSQREAQCVVNEIFGKGKYKVSQELC